MISDTKNRLTNNDILSQIKIEEYIVKTKHWHISIKLRFNGIFVFIKFLSSKMFNYY